MGKGVDDDTGLRDATTPLLFLDGSPDPVPSYALDRARAILAGPDTQHAAPPAASAALPGALVDEIVGRADAYWQERLQAGALAAAGAGKEFGHTAASSVEQQTAALLADHYDIGHQLGADGRPASRGMGDLWIRHEGIWHPVNVKTGNATKAARPNMVALQRLSNALVEGRISTYYLLIVKMDMDQRRAAVRMVDMLDYLDFVTYDAGTGQILLLEQEFNATAGQPLRTPTLTVEEKIDLLVDLSEAGLERLIRNRRERHRKLVVARSAYPAGQPLDQNSLDIG